MAREIEERVLCISDDKDWSLDDFQNTISTAIAKIPKEYLDKTKVSLGHDIQYEYGDCYANPILEVLYVRTETKEEAGAHKARSEAVFRHNEQQERALYEQLKAKYGG